MLLYYHRSLDTVDTRYPPTPPIRSLALPVQTPILIHDLCAVYGVHTFRTFRSGVLNRPPTVGSGLVDPERKR